MNLHDDAIVIVGGARTPVGSFGGSLAAVPAHELGATAARAALESAGVEPGEVGEWVVGCVGQTGKDAYIARRVALAAGAPTSSTAMTVNRICGSGLQALVTAGDELRRGDSDFVVAGGAESMSRQPYLDLAARSGYQLGNRELVDGTLSLVTDPFTGAAMGITAENVAERHGVSREEQDAFAVESQRRAQAALEADAMATEIAPVTITTRKGDQVVSVDEHPRAGITLERLAGMKPAFREGGSVTAGNSSGINDGAAMLVLTTASRARERGLTPLAELVDAAKAGCDPDVMGYAPRPAIEKVLARNGLSAADLGWIELNEAFAAQAFAVVRDTGLDREKVNPLGGAIAWGHPIGATGAILSLRTITNLRSRGLEWGLVSLCIGGGQALAAVFRAL